MAENEEFLTDDANEEYYDSEYAEEDYEYSDDFDSDYEENESEEEPSNNEEESKESSNSRISVLLTIVLSGLVGLSFLGFLISLILVFALHNNTGNFICFIVAICSFVLTVLIGFGFILYKKYFCLKCNELKTRDFYYLGTTKKIVESRKSPDPSKNYKKFIFTHHYECVSYCENCDVEESKEFTKSGGCLIKYYDGSVTDKRLDPLYPKKEAVEEEIEEDEEEDLEYEY